MGLDLMHSHFVDRWRVWDADDLSLSISKSYNLTLGAFQPSPGIFS